MVASGTWPRPGRPRCRLSRSTFRAAMRVRRPQAHGTEEQRGPLVVSLFKPLPMAASSRWSPSAAVPCSLLNIGVVPWNSKVGVSSTTRTRRPAHASGSSGSTFADPAAQVYPQPANGHAGGHDAGHLQGGEFRRAAAAQSGRQGCLQPSGTAMPNQARKCLGAGTVRLTPYPTDDGVHTNDYGLSLGARAGLARLEPIPSRRRAPPTAMRATGTTTILYGNSVGGPSGRRRLVPTTTSDLRHSEAAPVSPESAFCLTRWRAGQENDQRPGGQHGLPTRLRDCSGPTQLLLPGLPFSEASNRLPFSAQAIVFMTAARSAGGNGDAYHG